MFVDEKFDDDNRNASPARWLMSNLLAAFLLISVALILIIGSSVERNPPSVHRRYYLPPLSIAPPTSNNRNQSESLKWILPSKMAHYTATLLYRWLQPVGETCHDSRTVAISIPGLDNARFIKLSTGIVHEFRILALNNAGKPTCLGGDYFETDLSGNSWKSRPPVTDHGNGSYSLRLQVHDDFPGDYTLTIVLLFRHFEGLKFTPQKFRFRKVIREMKISFYRGNVVSLPQLQTCRGRDFHEESWSGRWTRHGGNDTCVIDDDGRYRCLPPNSQCRNPWCSGSLDSLESNGWVYSAHCSFRIFESDSAWKCLNNKWLFFWGDSNHVDTIRNMLNFVLGLTDIKSVPRRFDTKFTNPRNESESVRITSIYNGHWNVTRNYLGLQSLRNAYFRELLWRYFSEERVPDIMILNSGLHDGIYWRSLRRFIEGAEYAARFWEEILSHVKTKGIKMPKIFYRSTVATGGYARDLKFNPHKMEVFNQVVVEIFKENGLITGGVVDDFDMTFPWHYDNRCNDGVHYGRAPAKAKWPDGEIGHQYFVDLMLVHVLLNAMCNE